MIYPDLDLAQERDADRLEARLRTALQPLLDAGEINSAGLEVLVAAELRRFWESPYAPA